LNPAIPATNTDVSTTPLATFVWAANADLRQLPLGSAIRPDSRHDFGFCHTTQITGCGLWTARQLAVPARPSPAAGLILESLCARQLVREFFGELAQWKADFDGCLSSGGP
jgi:hypothetical protein